MCAASNILLITELLEQVLSHLPPLEIIRCQRVNNTWKGLITGSPLLQYKAWMRSECPDANHRVRSEDRMWHFSEGARFVDMEGYEKRRREHEMKRFIYDVSTHLNPIVVARIMQNLPEDPQYQIDDDLNLSLRAVLIRDFRQWYVRNRSSEHIWGNMSLYRPETRRIEWEISTSGDAGVSFHIEVAREEDFRGWTGHSSTRTQIKKDLGQPLVFTLSDLMGKLDQAWEAWIDAETDEHYLSHDGAGCDFDLGIPGTGCLDPPKDEDEDSEEEGGEEEEYESETFGCRMTMEEHIERAMWAASR